MLRPLRPHARAGLDCRAAGVAALAAAARAGRNLPGRHVEPERSSSGDGAGPLLRLFLSYASQDAERARRFAADLRRPGIEPWMDDELKLAGRWNDEIEDRIAACDLFVALMSHATQEGDAERFFRQRNSGWLMKAQRRFLPVRLEECQLPAELPKATGRRDREYLVRGTCSLPMRPACARSSASSMPRSGPACSRRRSPAWVRTIPAGGSGEWQLDEADTTRRDSRYAPCRGQGLAHAASASGGAPDRRARHQSAGRAAHAALSPPPSAVGAGRRRGALPDRDRRRGHQLDFPGGGGRRRLDDPLRAGAKSRHAPRPRSSSRSRSRAASTTSPRPKPGWTTFGLPDETPAARARQAHRSGTTTDDTAESSRTRGTAVGPGEAFDRRLDRLLHGQILAEVSHDAEVLDPGTGARRGLGQLFARRTARRLCCAMPVA